MGWFDSQIRERISNNKTTASKGILESGISCYEGDQ